MAVACLAIFAPGSVFAGSVARFDANNYYDFNGDTKSDVFATDAFGADTVVRVDALDPAYVGSFFPIVRSVFDVVGAGNFDRVLPTTEILSRDPNPLSPTGGTLYFLDPVEPTFTTSRAAFAHVSPDFSLVGIGKMNDDLVDDLVFYKRFGTGGPEGVIYVATLNPEGLIGVGSCPPKVACTFAIQDTYFPAALTATEIPIGVGNFDGALGGDIAVVDTVTGQIRVIPLSADASTAGTSLFPMIVPTGYTVFGVGYFDADDQLDFLLHALTSPLANLFRIDFTAPGGASISGVAFPSLLPADAIPAAIGNYDGQGPSDILGRYVSGGASGTLSQYLLNTDGSGTVSAINFPFGYDTLTYTVLQDHAVIP